MNSQANNIVASAVPPSDAQQSGGIQGAARNLGLALGSAAMGSVLLIAVNTGFDARIEASGMVDTQDKAALEEVVYTFESDAAFTARLESMNVALEVQGELLEDNAEVRANSAATAFYVVAGLAVAALATTFPKQTS